MISQFFVDRPIFANVIAVITVLFGVVALSRLPVEEYPSITPPTVQVTAAYPGANARVVADTVAAPIEQQVNGVENMLYMSSTSSSDGAYALTITFKIGTNLDDAQVQVQNRLAAAEPVLPEDVRRQGVKAEKQSSSIILVVSLTDPTGAHDSLFLSNYATLRLRDELSRVEGVGTVTVVGAGSYSMRVWLDPDKLAARQLTTQDVSAALARQNVQVAAGQIGQSPAEPGQRFQMTVTTLGRLSDPRQFEEIILKSGEAGQLVYLRDVARVELGAQNYDMFAVQAGRESAFLIVYQLPGSNAIEVAKGVRAAMEKVKPSLPEGVEYAIPFDTTKFVDAAISSVYHTLIEAGVLVLIVIMVFLQNWRALLVPATTVPVTIIGAFAFMALLGFSINLLTLFGLVLAIGIVVDDAIVIVENASHHIEKGLAPREATIRAMSEVTGPIISITLVLMAVFVPTAFLGGISGQMYRQFALTIAATALISALNALTLKPAQCAAWLRPHTGRNLFTRAFDFFYRPLEAAYSWSVRQLLKVWWAVLIVFLGLTAGTGWWYSKTPTGFLPQEDQGWVIVAVQLPDSASLSRTKDVTDKMNQILAATPGLDSWVVLGGMSLLEGTNAPNAATAFISFKDWSERKSPELMQQALVGRLMGSLNSIQEPFVLVLVPPPIMGLGVAGGFQMQIEDREGVGPDVLQERTQAIVAAAQRRPEIGMAASQFRAGVPQIYLNIDRAKAEKMGVMVSDIFATLQANLGSVYVNDFNKFDRTYQVRIQADARFRGDPGLIRKLEVRNRQNGKVPLSTLLTPETRTGPQSITRYNLYQTATINGAAGPGVSSGDALKAMEEVAGQELPRSMGFDWTAVSFQERRTGGAMFTLLGLPITEAMLVFGLAVFLVYLVLAAQYESWLLPFAVILVVPLGILGVVAGINARGMDNNVYTQIGVVLIIALASKNAILIVEFARELRLAGRSVREAAVEASRLRFRPILMTSIAFILGVVPLVIAEGAGAAGRQSLGTAVFGGMVTSTVLAVFFVPAFYVAIQSLIELISGPPKSHGEHLAVAAAELPIAEPVPETPAEGTSDPATATNPDAAKHP
ncbi:Efflux pump membrane transporter BepE [Gemmata obscuriglobus]|uniref:Hydrophobe/amphiphile efflux-1 family RND transporter n=1 Tax=Gemmata obscuriglobus TaxID=114 RepID=A0A2Z3GYN3_9BACT|nr:multidrug efflux RND transporter permease subunit [Gemmata obscuriglobus]AWM37761.1 hydrophobe/amphiphile efflux-1 family RND transporter [Gemmata obscuriglobus]QEG29427.1 Efflux pump membrane transporter BepE [Gemmata obscuriglobus]VTS08528.1 hydrophobe amphiphile efflux-1 family : Transporter, hydrophobe/amphiphile efflux-1 (HAE1) family OS=Rhodopirellula maiorica SM1 GN=RMSM_07794 PE=4 SV=1: ACR_tran [Gemmata obscuriglobus UQM 2246]